METDSYRAALKRPRDRVTEPRLWRSQRWPGWLTPRRPGARTPETTGRGLGEVERGTERLRVASSARLRLEVAWSAEAQRS